jgi:hypothetical protein
MRYISSAILYSDFEGDAYIIAAVSHSNHDSYLWPVANEIERLYFWTS